MKVDLFTTCLTDNFYPDVAASVVGVLRRLGIDVDVPADQTCCGQPAFNSGFLDEAREVAAHWLDVFEPCETIVTPSGSCCAMVRHYYPVLFADYPRDLERARTIGGRLFEFVEFVEKVLKIDWTPYQLRFDASATYHYSCHLRGIGMTDEVPRLLAKIEGLELRPLEKSDQCCGFGGTFAVKYGHISDALVGDKVDCVERTGADVLVVNDGGCALNISGVLHRRGSKIRVMHAAQILEAAMAE
ncbi:MAG: (Fe-S)-binding protein [Phycisphaerae bacterium]|nr:(Fe-S)-binding protein [Phycisphaerae bacterium]